MSVPALYVKCRQRLTYMHLCTKLHLLVCCSLHCPSKQSVQPDCTSITSLQPQDTYILTRNEFHHQHRPNPPTSLSFQQHDPRNLLHHLHNPHNPLALPEAFRPPRPPIPSLANCTNGHAVGPLRGNQILVGVLLLLLSINPSINET